MTHESRAGAERRRGATPVVRTDGGNVSRTDDRSGGGDGGGRPPDADDLRAELTALRRENERLRAESERIQRTRYRRAALAFLGIGLVAGTAGALFPSGRTVLLALAGVGLFAAVLTAFLTPEQFVSASTTERVYAAYAASGDALAGDLGLRDVSVYVPVDDASGPFAAVRLFVPQREEYTVPDAGALAQGVVVTADDQERGVSLYPTGAALLEELTEWEFALETTPEGLGDQLADALVTGLELVDTARAEVSGDGTRAVVTVSGGAYGAVDRFDHPVASFLASGFASGLDRPVRLAVESGDDDAYLVVLTWDGDSE